jgi:hypothetical protein
MSQVNDKKNFAINSSIVPGKLNPINVKNSSVITSNTNFNIRKPGEIINNDNRNADKANHSKTYINNNVASNHGFSFFDNNEPSNISNNNINNNQFNFEIQSQTPNNFNNKPNTNNASWSNNWGSSASDISNNQNKNNNLLNDFIFAYDNSETKFNHPNFQRMHSNTNNSPNPNLSNENPLDNINSNQTKVLENIAINNINNKNNDFKDIFSFVNNPLPANNMNPNPYQTNQINMNCGSNMINTRQQIDINQDNNQSKKKMDDLDNLLRDSSILSNNPIHMPNNPNSGNINVMGQENPNQHNQMMINFFNQMSISNPNINQQQLMQMFNMFMQNMQIQQGISMNYQNNNQQQMNNQTRGMMGNNNKNQIPSMNNPEQNNLFKGIQPNNEVNKVISLKLKVN